MSTTPWSARRDVEHRSRSSPRSSDAFRSPRWMIALRTRPIQNSFVAGARGDVVGIRAATDRPGGVCETLPVQRIERSCRILRLARRRAAGGGAGSDPCGSERGSVEGFSRPEFRSADLLQLAAIVERFRHGTRSQGRYVLARDRKAANRGRRLSRAGREILVFNASATASGQTRSAS